MLLARTVHGLVARLPLRPLGFAAASVLVAACYDGPPPEGPAWTTSTGPPGSGGDDSDSDGDATTNDPTDPAGGSSGAGTTDDDPGGGGSTGGGAGGGSTGPTSSGGSTSGDSSSTSGGSTSGSSTSTSSTSGSSTSGGSTSTSSTSSSTSGGGGGNDVPDNTYCNPVAGWDPQWAQLEQDILVLVNQHRASGANCGSRGSFGPTGPLTMQPNLRCAARVHSKDMDDRSFFDHTNPSGESPYDRMGRAGYSYSAAGENIAGGSSDAAGTMNQWMGSDGHCANIMNPNYTEIGVGYHPGGQWGHLWTQTFGRP